MKRTARNLITAFCCTGLLAAAGCTSSGELSVTGMYGSQGQALSGDRCDEFLMDAADSNTAEGEEQAKEAYRACVEDALNEDGRHGECRDRDDETCDIILDEVGDAIQRLRENAPDGQAPDCANASAGGEAALCHLMAAYEACELDRDNDGTPDVNDHPGDGGENPDETDPNDRPDQPGDDPVCEEWRARTQNVGDADAQHIMNEHPECFGVNPDGSTNEQPGADGTDANTPDGDGQSTEPDQTEPDANAEDAFCAALREEIANCENQDRCAELEATRNRECPI